MDIISARQDKREKQIDQIINSIREAYYNGEKIDKKKIVLATMANLSLAKRTAQEYVEIALFKGKIDIEKMNAETAAQTNLNKFSGANSQAEGVSNAPEVKGEVFPHTLSSPILADITFMQPDTNNEERQSVEHLLYELTGIKPSDIEIDDYLKLYKNNNLNIFSYAETLRNKHGVNTYTHAT